MLHEKRTEIGPNVTTIVALFVVYPAMRYAESHTTTIIKARVNILTRPGGLWTAVWDSV